MSCIMGIVVSNPLGTKNQDISTGTASIFTMFFNLSLANPRTSCQGNNSYINYFKRKQKTIIKITLSM